MDVFGHGTMGFDSGPRMPTQHVSQQVPYPSLQRADFESEVEFVYRQFPFDEGDHDVDYHPEPNADPPYDKMAKVTAQLRQLVNVLNRKLLGNFA